MEALCWSMCKAARFQPGGLHSRHPLPTLRCSGHCTSHPSSESGPRSLSPPPPTPPPQAGRVPSFLPRDCHTHKTWTNWYRGPFPYTPRAKGARFQPSSSQAHRQPWVPLGNFPGSGMAARVRAGMSSPLTPDPGAHRTCVHTHPASAVSLQILPEV